MDILAVFSKLDHGDRRAVRNFWAHAGALGTIDRVPDHLLDAAFAALDRIGEETPDMVYKDTGPSSFGACTLIRRAIEERPDERDALLRRLAHYYESPNIAVSAAAVRALERSDTCKLLAVPYLRVAAAAEHTLRSPDGLALRGLACIMLLKCGESLKGKCYEAARTDAAVILHHWASHSNSPDFNAEWIALINALESRDP